jgi:alkane 1-monooxygenase
VILPILDYALPVDNYNPSEARARLLEKDKRYLIPLYCMYFTDLFTTVWFLHRVSTGEIGATFGNLVFYAFCLAHIGGMNAVVGHELIHRRFILHKIAGVSAYAKMFYSHYFIQHVRAHHKMVATPFDASTSYLDEDVF